MIFKAKHLFILDWIAIILLLFIFESRSLAQNEVSVKISTRSCVMQIKDGVKTTYYPVGIGRKHLAFGTFYLGPNVLDRSFYEKSRKEPAFQRGLPFIRLSPYRLRGQSDPNYQKAIDYALGIHGPVTPSLIWGRVSAGCIRMRKKDVREFYEFARLHPNLAIRLTDKKMAFNYTFKIKPLRKLKANQRSRLCSRDEWFKIPLESGDKIRIELNQSLKLELYGIRGISVIAEATQSLFFIMKEAPKNRGTRYLRVINRKKGCLSYTMKYSRM